MRSKSFFFYKVCLIFLSFGMALMFVGVLIVQAKGWEQGIASPGEGKSPNAPGTITGTVTYTGTITGTHMVWIGAFTSTQGVPPAFSVIATVLDLIHWLMLPKGSTTSWLAWTLMNSGGPPDPNIDPIGLYPNNPVTVTNSALITGVDIALYDPTPPPQPQAVFLVGSAIQAKYHPPTKLSSLQHVGDTSHPPILP